jgi:hypothetical protein
MSVVLRMIVLLALRKDLPLVWKKEMAVTWNITVKDLDQTVQRVFI